MTMRYAVVIMLMALTYNIISTRAASNQHIDFCKEEVKWVAEAYDLLEQDPKVILNSTNEVDQNRLDFVKKWQREGKGKEELKSYVLAKCTGGQET